MSAQLRQQTISFSSAGRLQANRPGPRPKAPTTLTPAASSALINGARRRRKVGGINEAEVIEAFQSSRAHYDAGEPDSGASDSDDDMGPKKKQRRIGYSREKKLQAITYVTSTDMPGKKGGPDIPITLSYAAKQLRIDRHCLRDWKDNKAKILGMKKGALRCRGRSVGREPEMEFKLNAQFEQARAIGRIISSKWFINHAKAIYRI